MLERPDNVATDGMDADLMSSLEKVNFTEYEARVYLSLLALNPATGYELAKAIGAPRANVYDTLEALVRKQVIQPLSEKPVRYVPVPAQEVFGRLKADVARLCDNLVSALPTRQQATSVDFVWHLRGLNQIYDKMGEFIRAARHTIWIKSLDKHILAHRDELERSARDGVKMSFVIFGNQALDFGVTYLHEGTGMPIADAEYNVVLTVDHSRALMGSMRNEPTAIYTSNEAIVSIVDTLIRHDIYITEICRELGPAVSRVFGPSLLRLRRRLLSPRQGKELVHQLRARKLGA